MPLVDKLRFNCSSIPLAWWCPLKVYACLVSTDLARALTLSVTLLSMISLIVLTFVTSCWTYSCSGTILRRIERLMWIFPLSLVHTSLFGDSYTKSYIETKYFASVHGRQAINPGFPYPTKAPELKTTAMVPSGLLKDIMGDFKLTWQYRVHNCCALVRRPKLSHLLGDTCRSICSTCWRLRSWLSRILLSALFSWRWRCFPNLMAYLFKRKI